MCQCPLGLLPHFYRDMYKLLSCLSRKGVNALSGCYLISTWYQQRTRKDPFAKSVNALSGLCLIVTEEIVDNLFNKYTSCVNALSGCYLISTEICINFYPVFHGKVSMPSRAVTSFLPQIWQKKLVMLKTSCQCPLGLLPHFYLVSAADTQRPVCQKCQCPLGLLPHFYINLVVLFAVITTIVSMPSRAVTSFLLSAVLRISGIRILSVNALSGCYLISTLRIPSSISFLASCQCPLGLLPHFYLWALFELLR